MVVKRANDRGQILLTLGCFVEDNDSEQVEDARKGAKMARSAYNRHMQTRFTKEGYEKLKNDYGNLVKERVLAVEDLQKARAMGDLSENGYYKAARMKLSTIDRNLRRMTLLLEKGIVVEKTSFVTVGIGCSVTLLDGKTEVAYHIVGDIEADPTSKKISLLSPLGKALFGKKIGEEVFVETPSGKKVYKVLRLW